MSTFSRFPGQQRMRWSNYITPAIRNLIIACTAVFVVQKVLEMFAPGAARWMLLELGLVPVLVTRGLRLWQPATYLFLHDPNSLMHLLFNMLFLWMFGVDLERTWGERRFYSYFFLTGIGAGLINVLVKTIIDPQGLNSAAIPTIGASGAIYGILLAAAVMFPDRKVWLIPFPVHHSDEDLRARRRPEPSNFSSTLGTGGDSVSHVTHLGGMQFRLPLSAARLLVLPRAQQRLRLEAQAGTARTKEAR